MRRLEQASICEFQLSISIRKLSFTTCVAWPRSAASRSSNTLTASAAREANVLGNRLGNAHGVGRVLGAVNGQKKAGERFPGFVDPNQLQIDLAARNARKAEDARTKHQQRAGFGNRARTQESPGHAICPPSLVGGRDVYANARILAGGEAGK